MSTDQTPDPSTSGANARARLIEVAVKHFADHGYAAASQRAIQREAGVNIASAHYYFGSKEAMFRAVIDTFIHDVQQERIRRHQAIPADVAGRPRLERLLFDYYQPGFAVAANPTGFHYARILARVQGERPGQPIAIFEDIVKPVRETYVDSLHQLYPARTRDEVRDLLTTGVTIMAIGAVSAPDGNLRPPSDVEAQAQRVATIVAAAFEALLGPPVHQS
ncbi:MAG: TetR/AcrR family transcriptional regulator [Sphingopyxis sp.]|nr:TetR/AcrR family transcriptional regulator [Sphingopyxis sp.]